MKMSKQSAEMLMGSAIAWGAALVYLVLPVDLVPDFLPLLGQIDDLLAIMAAAGVSLWTWRTLRADQIVDHLPDGLGLLREDDPQAYGWEAYEPIRADKLKAL